MIACNNDGVWNETGAILDFIIAPAWYQTIWFRGFYLLAFLTGSGAFIKCVFTNCRSRRRHSARR